MRHRLAVALLIAVAAVAAAPPALAQAAPAQASAFVGQWHWNRAESSGMEPGEPLPNDVVLTIAAADPARVQWTLRAVDAQGQVRVESYSGTGDGKSAPVSGAPDGATAAYTVTPAAIQAVFTSKDGSVERTTCTLSADRRKLICHGTEEDGRNPPRPFQDVYDRR
jgi:opacity protein-like surface antigen